MLHEGLDYSAFASFEQGSVQQAATSLARGLVANEASWPCSLALLTTDFIEPARDAIESLALQLLEVMRISTADQDRLVLAYSRAAALGCQQRLWCDVDAWLSALADELSTDDVRLSNAVAFARERVSAVADGNIMSTAPFAKGSGVNLWIIVGDGFWMRAAWARSSVSAMIRWFELMTFVNEYVVRGITRSVLRSTRLQWAEKRVRMKRDPATDNLVVRAQTQLLTENQGNIMVHYFLLKKEIR